MTEAERNALLPAGLRDILPEDAAFEAETVERLMSAFAAHGYQRVKPPLIEFEESLLSGAGVAVGHQTFRLMDPVSQRMMGVRADITPQISRIARTRLANEPRPLRLSYAGDVLRVRGSQLRPERQLTQVGAELVGSAAPEADAEIIVMAIRAIERTGIKALSVDLTVPRLVPQILGFFGIAAERERDVREALDRKDASAVALSAGEAAPALNALLKATGSALAGLEILQSADMPGEAAREVVPVARVAELLGEQAPEIQLTIDPVEHRGFEYHTGIGFTIFSRGPAAELAGGGRYRVRAGQDEDGERATGVTLYVDAIIGTLEKPDGARRVLMPIGSSPDRVASLQEEGWVTVAALDSLDDVDAAAAAQKCGYVFEDEKPRPVKGIG